MYQYKSLSRSEGGNCGFVFCLQVAEEMVTLAYESGINVFDTAEVYAAGKYVDWLHSAIYISFIFKPFQYPILMYKAI